MFSKKIILKVSAALTVVLLIVGCSEDETVKTEIQNFKQQSIVLDVYKSPTCGCCKKWINHIDDNGFQSKIHNRQNISSIKNDKGIEPRYRSCHTAISKDGYAFEGHIPAKYIQKFLKEPQLDGVIGLSVPAMPVGTPGMEVGDKFQPYKVLLLKSDGTYEVYASVKSYKEQF
tara:strand:- start:725 stop:1243 length:519 start_codon:yes stop_codon:yes gene_type:complete